MTKGFPQGLIRSGQWISMGVLVLSAGAALVASGLAGAGVLAWPDVQLSFGAVRVDHAGAAIQIALTVILVALALVVPSATRVSALEYSHRRFHMDMDDVTRAYRAAHMADRAEMFEMHREFDAVRERYAYLKERPELAEMDTELLTMAAQMSTLSQDLAKTYSEAKVTRARHSLRERLTDAETLQERIQDAHAVIREVRRLTDAVDHEESVVRAQMAQLRDMLGELNLAPEPPLSDGPKIVRIQPGA